MFATLFHHPIYTLFAVLAGALTGFFVFRNNPKSQAELNALVAKYQSKIKR